MRLQALRPKHARLLIAAAIALTLVAVAPFLRPDIVDRATDRRVVAAANTRVASASTRPLGRKQCERKCAAIRKGYIYRAELDGSSRLEPEFCSCV